MRRITSELPSMRRFLPHSIIFLGVHILVIAAVFVLG
jgi:hypothetical protein